MSRQPDLVIANATVVNSYGRQNAHIVIRDGLVVQLLEVTEAVPAAARTIDCPPMSISSMSSSTMIPGRSSAVAKG